MWHYSVYLQQLDRTAYEQLKTLLAHWYVQGRTQFICRWEGRPVGSDTVSSRGLTASRDERD